MTAAPDPPRWSDVTDLFHRALAEPADRRDAFLDAVCAGNAGLRREVGSLLAAHEEPDGILDRPAVSVHGLLDDDRARRAAVGRRIGPYQVLDVLGEGGMGIVYRALDTRLHRIVALKALPSGVADDATRRERLRREARAAAALSHTGIATVYALEEIDDHVYIAAEYVPGETLRDELDRGPLPLARALETGLALARGLAAAEARGIVHRDLKPENVIRTPDGAVKILDFGLARFGGHPRLTLEGGQLGTPAYMSPEQIRGEDVDTRSDIFALGGILCEMLTGAPPFGGTGSADTIARVLEAEPALPSEAGDAAWQAARAVVARCLRKAPSARFQHATELVAWLAQAGGPAPEQARIEQASFPQTANPTAYWWWQFHEAAASAGYVAALVPLWFFSEHRQEAVATGLFVLALVSAVSATLLRLHLWFAVRSYPAEAEAQRRAVARWLRAADLAFAVALLGSGLTGLPASRAAGLALVATSVAVVVAAVVIEPATARAAFGGFRSSCSRRRSKRRGRRAVGRSPRRS
jgi:hypothetical protein